MILNDPNEIEADLAEEGAAVGLLALMKGLSEECWCAGWMSGMEYDLWLVEAGREWGQGAITERQATLLRLLSDECGGWWHWTNDGPKFIRAETWRAKIRTRAAANT